MKLNFTIIKGNEKIVGASASAHITQEGGMAKGQVKKAQVQADQMIFALDIGTRSVIGMIGVVEEDKVKIIAIEKEEHNERAMIDGQIENIDKEIGRAHV